MTIYYKVPQLEVSKITDDDLVFVQDRIYNEYYDDEESPETIKSPIGESCDAEGFELPENYGEHRKSLISNAEVTKQEKSSEEQRLEEQLLNVQSQLQMLSNLPQTIQATLNAVTDQLCELMLSYKQLSRNILNCLKIIFHFKIIII